MEIPDLLRQLRLRVTALKSKAGGFVGNDGCGLEIPDLLRQLRLRVAALKRMAGGFVGNDGCGLEIPAFLPVHQPVDGRRARDDKGRAFATAEELSK